MFRLGIAPRRLIGLVALCAALGGCGSSSAPKGAHDRGAPLPGHDTRLVYIYSSLPLRGPQAADARQVLDGIKLELARVHYHVDGYRIRYRSLDDSSARRGVSLTQTVAHAEDVARNPQAIAYIGDLDSGATKLSLPILNQAGIVQITPGSGYPGLTNNLGPAVTAPGEPSRYYPQGTRTLLRLIPSDMVEAAAAAQWLHAEHCEHVTALPMGGSDASSVAAAVRETVETFKQYGLIYVAPHTPLPTRASDFLAFAAGLRAAGIGCVVLTGHVTPAAVALTRELHYQLPPGAVIVGTSGLCNARWTSAARGGVTSAVDRSLYCTSPYLPLKGYAGAERRLASFQRSFHLAPTAYAVYGYQAAEMVVSAMDNLAGGLDNRRQLLTALTDGGPHFSDVLGSYTFDVDGNLVEPRAYGLFSVSAGGLPRYDGTLAPGYVL